LGLLGLLTGLLAAALLLARLLAGVLGLLPGLAGLVLILLVLLAHSEDLRWLNATGTNVRPRRWLGEQGSLTGYCVSTNCHSHGVGTDNKTIQQKQSCRTALLTLWFCCHLWFPLLENTSDASSKAARGPSPRRSGSRFQAKWLPIRAQKAHQNETGICWF
jgi:hypothetical protein